MQTFTSLCNFFLALFADRIINHNFLTFRLFRQIFRKFPKKSETFAKICKSVLFYLEPWEFTMKNKQVWQKSLVAIAVTSMTITSGFKLNANAMTTTPQLSEQPNLSLTSPLNQGEYQLAADSSMCRVVISSKGLIVRSSPGVNSNNVIKTLPYHQQVTIVNRGKSGWVPISSPVNGYVAARYLRRCS